MLLVPLYHKSLFGDKYHRLFNANAAKATIKSAEKASEAIEYLTKSPSKAILVTDEGLTMAKHFVVLAKIKEYVCGGGTVVIGGNLSYYYT